MKVPAVVELALKLKTTGERNLLTTEHQVACIQANIVHARNRMPDKPTLKESMGGCDRCETNAGIIFLEQGGVLTWPVFY